MAEKSDDAELIGDGKVMEKAAEKVEEPKKEVAPEATKPAPPPPAHSGLTEDKNEPHMHLAILLVIVIILGVIIAFVKF